jgi:hypothetical protein
VVAHRVSQLSGKSLRNGGTALVNQLHRNHMHVSVLKSKMIHLEQQYFVRMISEHNTVVKKKLEKEIDEVKI